MKTFLIEREIPGASELTEQQLAEIALTSNTAVQSLGVPYTWINSYVAGDKVYCIHEAEDEETIREHARRGGFPADVVSVVVNEFGPVRQRALDLLADPAELDRVLAVNAAKAEEVAQATLAAVYDKVGLLRRG